MTSDIINKTAFDGLEEAMRRAIETDFDAAYTVKKLMKQKSCLKYF